MNTNVLSLLAQLGQEHCDIFKSAVLPDCWGFSFEPTLPHLQSDLGRIKHTVQNQSTEQNREKRFDHEAPDSYLSILESSHAFTSNHCISTMAEAYGVSEFTTSLFGSFLVSNLTNSTAAAAAVQAIKQQVDQAWSEEAVKTGVACAKLGEYQQALDCYNKALTLNPSNCDAYVARGAAHANQKHFHAAVADFQAALRLDPSNANAAKYLQATTEHMQATAASEEARHAVQQQHKQQHHQRLQQQTGNVQQQQSAGHQQHGQDALRGSLSDRHQQQQATTGVISSHNAQQQQQQQQGHSRGAHKRPRSSSRSRSREARKRYDSGSSSDDSSEPSADPDEQGVTAEALKAPTAADIKEALELVRSAKKASKKDRHKSSGKKKKKHKHKHSSKHKHHKKHGR